MPTFFFIFFFLIVYCAPIVTPTPTLSHSRRILHQPFFPLNSLPPSQPPSLPPPFPPPPPTTPKFPFSSSTPIQSPFFPSYPSPPSPPPPSASTFASFPANISSLILPRSPQPKPNSKKLLIVAIAAVISAVVVLSIIVFLYFRRRRRRRFTDDKTYVSDNSHRLYPPPNSDIRNSSAHKLRTSSTTSSEFLYLGTLVNSRGVDDNSSSRNNVGSVSRKLDSPELRPLPPLSGQSFRQDCENGEVGSNGDEEEEEFYSPRVSLGGRESSSGTGSGSRRMLASVAAEHFEARNSDSSSCSCSSSSSGSPARSLSVSISPPVSLSPRRSDPKSPESMTVQARLAPPPLPPRQLLEGPLDSERSSPLQSSQCSSPETDLKRNSDASPRICYDLVRNVRSPSLSLASTSPHRGLTKDPNESPILSTMNDRNVRSGSLSLASLSPDRDVVNDPDVSPRKSTLSDQDVSMSSASTSQSRSSVKSPVASPRATNVFGQNTVSHSLSCVSLSPSRGLEKNIESSPRISLSLSSASSSPERSYRKSSDSSPRISNVSDHNKQSSLQSSPSSSPSTGLEKSPDLLPIISYGRSLNALSPATINGGFQQRKSVSPPPPPPPPPLQVPATPMSQPISKPPPLIPPSRPFVIQNPTKVSPMELPLSSNPTEKLDETPKPKLKPLHWDKVRASSDREMVWDHLRSSSFKLNEEMIETLFVVNTPNPKPKETTPRSALPSPNQENRVLDPKKSQNIAISLRALNVTVEEVCEALLEGNAETIGTELLESLLKMAPTKEEERKLKEFKDDSPVKLGPAERFLKAMLDIPFAFKRVDAMLYIANFESEVEYLKRSFETLEAACEELRNSRMFLKLLEAVLKTGNRMNVGTNRGDAHAFKLDTLLKLVDVKGADGKTTLLHFVVQEIIKAEGARLSTANTTLNPTLSEDAKCRKLGLQVVSGLSSELTNVKKAAAMDSDVLSNDVSKLSRGIANIGEVVQLIETIGSNDGAQKFSESMNRFMKMAEEEIIRIQAQESVALSLVKEITEYFHGNSAKEEAHPFRIFMVVRDFLTILDRVCKEVGMINERTIVSSAHKFPVPVNPMLPQVFPVNPTLPQVFPGFHGKRQCSSSDEEDGASH